MHYLTFITNRKLALQNFIIFYSYCKFKSYKGNKSMARNKNQKVIRNLLVLTEKLRITF